MARIRTLKPEHRGHRKVGRLDDRAYRLWVGMIIEADDEGRLVCDPEYLRATIFGYQRKTSVEMVVSCVRELESHGLIVLYRIDGVNYAAFPSWHDHQRIDKPQPSKLPGYQDSENVPITFQERSDWKGRERNGMEVEGNTPLPPVAAAPLRRASDPLEGFEEFWDAYPEHQRVKQPKARRAWRALKITPSLRQSIMAALAAHKIGRAWLDEGGRYVPQPHNWLADHRWEDPPPAAQATLFTSKTSGNQAAATKFLQRMGVTPT